MVHDGVAYNAVQVNGGELNPGKDLSATGREGGGRVNGVSGTSEGGEGNSCDDKSCRCILAQVNE